MTNKSTLNCGTKMRTGLTKFQLPNAYKRFGIAVAMTAFLSLIVNKLTVDIFTWSAIGKYAILLGLLIVSISKEKIEDERIIKLRMQSYAIAFIVAVLYTLTVPAIEYVADFILQSGTSGLKQAGDFLILWILLSIQIFYFESLKRRHQ